MNQDRDFITIGTVRVRHATACRDWVCGTCGGTLVTRFYQDAPHWRTVCSQDELHDSQQFIHQSTWEYLKHREFMDAAQAREVLEHLPPELQEAMAAE